MVSLESPDKPEDIELIRRMLDNHVRFTDSPIAKEILTDWENELRRFVKVMPNDYRRVLEKQAEIEAQAQMLAQRQTAGA
jgi:glutamate synthase domain-containing protein 3